MNDDNSERRNIHQRGYLQMKLPYLELTLHNTWVMLDIFQVKETETGEYSKR
jgi:hypothetical protein